MAREFGSQALVLSIDAIRTADGLRVYDHRTEQITDLLPDVWAHEVQERGAGEILINSVDRDGKATDMISNLLNQLCNQPCCLLLYEVQAVIAISQKSFLRQVQQQLLLEIF